MAQWSSVCRGVLQQFVLVRRPSPRHQLTGIQLLFCLLICHQPLFIQNSTEWVWDKADTFPAAKANLSGSHWWQRPSETLEVWEVFLKCCVEVTCSFDEAGSLSHSPLPHLDGPLQLRLLVTQPHHPNDCHGNAEPVEETEEVNDGVDVLGEGVEQCHQTLETQRKKKKWWNTHTTALIASYLFWLIRSCKQTTKSNKFTGCIYWLTE